ncbi:hypothetical protein [Variovorax sp. CF313]|uniref:hypothetical protein n=1 Tax=Variovorax sp. CF313 TaxID=1144315 RepID=UPI0005B2E67D|nr:hypothetical protein [Variovorax sp. CF313]
MIDKELEEQIQILTAWARRNMTYEQATFLFAVHKVVLDDLKATFDRSNKDHQQASTMLAEAGASELKTAALLKEMAAELEAAMPRLLRQAAAAGGAVYKRQASKRAKDAADHRHSSPGGAREKAESIRREWASGKYSTRERCAEEEHAALGMSYSSAIKALRNVPKPNPS